MNRATERNKKCENCGTTFHCPYGYGVKQWNKRRFCGYSCASIVSSKEKKGRHYSPETELKRGDFIPHANPNCSCWRCTKTPWNKGKKCPQLSGSNHSHWKGGKVLHQEKYWLIHKPDHPNADKGGYIREHRLVMEKLLNRYLNKEELVHHIDGDTKNNDPKNLELTTRSEHIRMHHEKILDARWQ